MKRGEVFAIQHLSLALARRP